MAQALIALADMRANFFSVAVLLTLGVLILRRVRRDRMSPSSRWIPITCLLAGPLSAVIWLTVDYLIHLQEYAAGDFWATAWRVLAVGLFAGVVSAIVLTVGVQRPTEDR